MMFSVQAVSEVVSSASPAAASDTQNVQSDRLSVPSQFKGKFTDSQITSFQEVFTFYDKDASGNIDRDELASVLQTLGEDVTDAKLDEMVSEVDQDGDGEVSWAEFLHVMTLSKVSLFKGVTNLAFSFDTGMSHMVKSTKTALVGRRGSPTDFLRP